MTVVSESDSVPPSAAIPPPTSVPGVPPAGATPPLSVRLVSLTSTSDGTPLGMVTTRPVPPASTMVGPCSPGTSGTPPMMDTLWVMVSVSW